MHRFAAPLAVLLALLATACGGSKQEAKPSDPVANVPTENGIRTSVEAAAKPAASEFPDTAGKTLQELAKSMKPGPSLALASSIFTAGGPSRMAFGMVGQDGTPV